MLQRTNRNFRTEKIVLLKNNAKSSNFGDIQEIQIFLESTRKARLNELMKHRNFEKKFKREKLDYIG